MKFHPILFSTPMVIAIGDGTKRQTRRSKGLEKVNDNLDIILDLKLISDSELTYALIRTKEKGTYKVKCPYQVGDVFWVRETFEYFESNYNPHGKVLDKDSTVKIQFKADRKVSEEFPIENIKALKAFAEIQMSKSVFKPSIFMPKPAARYFLKIKSIKVERIQQINEADAKAEGAKDTLKYNDFKFFEGLKGWNIPRPFSPHQFGFLFIWCKINGAENWLKNPFVWVYEFEKIEKPDNFI